MDDEEWELRQKVCRVLYKYGMCGSDPSTVIDELAEQGITFIMKKGGENNESGDATYPGPFC